MTDCLFCKFSKKEIKKEFVLETDKVMVFPDIKPMAKVHLLIVSKKHISEFSKLKNDEQGIWEEIIGILQKLIKQFKLGKLGYRIVINGGGAQIIDHLHVHLMGGVSL